MKTGIWLIAALMLSACSTVHYNRSQVLLRKNNIATLQDRVDQASARDIELLAPTTFEKAHKLLKQALNEAEKSKDPNAGNDTAKEGLAVLDKAESLAASSSNTLSDALAKMKSAEQAHAQHLFKGEFEELVKSLKNAAKALEEGNQKEGLEKNAQLAVAFGNLELKALKINISQQAEEAYKEALAANANKLAPITLASAKTELDIARKIIDVEKGNYEKAEYHAERARAFALRAKNIADILVGFKTEKYTEEQIILWYQNQLSQIHTPFAEDILFDQPNKDVVSTFESELASTLGNLRELEVRALAAEKKIALLTHKLVTHDELFNEVTALFNNKEAEVVKRDNDIIIRAYGFYFPSGKAELLPRNFGLLNKIVTAIVKFPNANIVVEGHTDSTGTLALNMTLSEQRAKNIAEFLIKLAGIESSRVTSVGVGPEKPIASNQTEEGRALNRRIEIIIKG